MLAMRQEAEASDSGADEASVREAAMGERSV